MEKRESDSKIRTKYDAEMNNEDKEWAAKRGTQRDARKEKTGWKNKI